jgi:hypothetical protein
LEEFGGGKKLIEPQEDGLFSKAEKLYFTDLQKGKYRFLEAAEPNEDTQNIFNLWA